MRRLWFVTLAIGMMSSSSCAVYERIFGTKKLNVAPVESLRPEAYGPIDRPSGYNAAITWLNVCQMDSRSTDGYALVYSLNLIGVNTSGSWVPTYEQPYSSGVVAGGLYSRSPWFREMLAGQEVFSVENGVLRVPTGDRPECVFHPWQAKWPRVELFDDIVRVLATADIQCFGNAVAQVGADYWPGPYTTSDTTPPGKEYEAGASRWISAADGRVTLLLGE